MDRKPLGRGLGALIPPADLNRKRDFFQCAIEEIRPSPFQPRKSFDEARIEELAASIREMGIIQPIIVRPLPTGQYELVAGERRWRAAQRAGLQTVPVVIKDLQDADTVALALIENIQRQDLNAVEEAEALGRLVQEFGLTQEQVAQRVGKDRSTITNALRLLLLPDAAKSAIIEGVLSAGHARAILMFEERARQLQLLDIIIEKSLTVRQAETLARTRATGKTGQGRRAVTPDYDRRHLEEDLKKALGTQVRIRARGSKGKIEVEFYSEEELSRLYDLLTR
ncbi:MAG: ParB/RepB/Spo0J family partition protein [Candidatus Methylomirabilis sp.]|nr:ParB/RepB/Spo0J family partition protein [Deltaproteobacteria bacterium]